MRQTSRWMACVAGIVLMVTVGAAVCHADAQRADHMQAIAEEAYVQGDFERAYRFFELAYAADLSRTDNLHRQALCAGQLSDFAKAELLLRDVVAKSDARPDARLDLGVALYMQRRYRESYEELETARANGVASPTLDYYRGACLFRVGQYQEALDPLRAAAADLPRRNAYLGYYLGGSELAQDNYDEAIEHLQQAYEMTEPGEFRDVIGRLLVQAEEKRRRARWWKFSIDLGGAYDSNVFYEPEEFEIADREGVYGYTDIDLALYPVRKDWLHLGVGYRFYQSLHVDQTPDQLLSDFNLTSHSPRAEAMLRLASGRVPVYAGVWVELSRNFLAGDHYQDATVYAPYLTVAETHWTATRLGARLETNRFKDFNERDAFYASPALSQIFAYAGGSGRLVVEASYEHNDADAMPYSYRGAGGYLATDFTLVGPLDLLAGWRYRYLAYVKSDENRIDRKMVVDAALRAHATEFLAFGSGYRFQNNVSLDVYQYEKHVFYIEMGLAF